MLNTTHLAVVKNVLALIANGGVGILREALRKGFKKLSILMGVAVTQDVPPFGMWQFCR